MADTKNTTPQPPPIPLRSIGGGALLRSYSRPRKSGAPAWWLQRVTGLALVVLTVGHYILMHYNPVSGHDYGETASRLVSPWFKGIYLGFITIGMYHGLQGIWNIVRDYKLKPAVGLTIFGVIFIAGVIFVAVGWNTILTFDPLKP
jgi:succinate dehydrogenase / fumarate reductase membrane anchor subunit